MKADRDNWLVKCSMFNRYRLKQILLGISPNYPSVEVGNYYGIINSVEYAIQGGEQERKDNHVKNLGCEVTINESLKLIKVI